MFDTLYCKLLHFKFKKKKNLYLLILFSIFFSFSKGNKIGLVSVSFFQLDLCLIYPVNFFFNITSKIASSSTMKIEIKYYAFLFSIFLAYKTVLYVSAFLLCIEVKGRGKERKEIVFKKVVARYDFEGESQLV